MIQLTEEYHLSVRWMIKFAVHPISTLACSNVVVTITFIRAFREPSQDHISPIGVRLDRHVLPHCCFYKTEQNSVPIQGHSIYFKNSFQQKRVQWIYFTSECMEESRCKVSHTLTKHQACETQIYALSL